MDWRRRGLGRGCVDAMGFASRAREAERASRDARRDARDGDGCVIFFNIVYARVMGCVY